MSVQPISPLHRIPPTLDERLDAVAVTMDYLELPSARMPLVRDDAVHVIVTDAAQLSQWTYQLGGEVSRAPMLDGASLWTLRTRTPERGDGSTVEIRVHAAIVTNEDVLAEVHGPVSA